MAQTPENRVKAKVKKILDGLGAYHFPAATHGYGRSGVPDFVGCYKGKFFAIECKANGGRITALQERNLDQIQKNGGVAILVDETGLDLLDKTLAHTAYWSGDLGLYHNYSKIKEEQ